MRLADSTPFGTGAATVGRESRSAEQTARAFMTNSGEIPQAYTAGPGPCNHPLHGRYRYCRRYEAGRGKWFLQEPLVGEIKGGHFSADPIERPDLSK
jgi:hypothetical protein